MKLVHCLAFDNLRGDIFGEGVRPGPFHLQCDSTLREKENTCQPVGRDRWATRKMVSQLQKLTLASTVLALALAGCTSSKNIELPDGRQGYAINCGGAVLDWSSCLKKAGDKCGKAGFDLLMRNEKTRQRGVVSADPRTIQETSMPVTDREMVIACKTPPIQ